MFSTHGEAKSPPDEEAHRGVCHRRVLLPVLVLTCFSTIVSPAHGQYHFGTDISITGAGSTVCAGQRNMAAIGDTVFAVWDNYPVFLSRSLDGGRSFQAPVRVSDSDCGYYGALAVDRTGQYVYVVWEDQRHYPIRAAYFDRSCDGGVTFGQDIRLSLDGPGEYPTVVTDGDELVYVVWEQDGSLYPARSEDRGVSFCPEARIDLPWPYVDEPALAISSEGKLFLAYEDHSWVEFIAVATTTSSDSGRSFLSPVEISWSAGNPSVIVDPQGVFHVAYVYSFSPPVEPETLEVRVISSTDGGLSFGPPSTVGQFDPSGASCCISASHRRLAVAWDQSRYQVGFAWRDSGAEGFSAPVVVNDGPSGMVARPSVALNERNVAYVMWDAADVYFDRGTMPFTTEVPSADPTARGAAAPSGITLLPPVPNPITQGGRIRYVLPPRETPWSVALAIYDIRGRLVAPLEQGAAGPGMHECAWAGTDRTGLPVPAGVYFAHLTASGETITSRLVVIR